MSPFTLPPRASLEQLKNQARDLLNAHRYYDQVVAPRFRDALRRLAGASDAKVLQAKVSLRDAQRVIAREYGFADWRALAAQFDSTPEPEPRAAAVPPTIDLDLHPASGRLAVSRWRKLEDELAIELLDVRSGERLGEIPHQFLPTSPAFSPDGRQVAFCGNRRLAIHDVETGVTRTVVDLQGWYVQFTAWSPDGQSLAFHALGVPLDPTKSSAIFRVDLQDDRVRRLTRGEGTHFDVIPQWSPSGRLLAFERGVYVNAREFKSSVVLADAAGSERHLPVPEDGSQSVRRYCWSPDGVHLLIRDASSGPKVLKVLDVNTLETVWSLKDDEVKGACFDPYAPRILCVGNSFLRLVAFPSGKPIAELDFSGLAPVQRVAAGWAVVFDNTSESVYYIGTDGDIHRWRISGGSEMVLEGDTEEEPEWRKEKYVFTTRDGLGIPVQRYLPSTANGRAVVYMDGGPIEAHNAISHRLLDEGYEVVRPAFRGMSGHGERHREAIQDEYGRADVQDIVDCGLDWKRRFDAADRPLAVVGSAYGGYLTFLALTHPEATWSCGVTLWGGTQLYPFGLLIDADHQTRYERSPVAHAHKTRFPLLILHGGREVSSTLEDVRSIRNQVEEAGALCDLVVFEEDTHGLQLSRPEMFRRMMDFLDKHAVRANAAEEVTS